MIFVTVGTQGPFDRLVRTVDDWAGSRGRSDVFAQIGQSEYRPKHIAASRFLDPSEFRSRIEGAELVVAHAGMGSIMTALEHGKAIIVMPRLADLHEQRNDHQLATANYFALQGRIVVALNERELVQKLDRPIAICAGEPVRNQASPELIETIRAFLNGKPYSVAPVDFDSPKPKIGRPD
jgi:UDP-N-acetylglucosamine transferase subunit ALG13